MKKSIVIFFSLISIAFLNCGTAIGTMGLENNNKGKSKDSLLVGLLALSFPETGTSTGTGTFGVDFTIPSAWEVDVNTFPVIYVKFTDLIQPSTVSVTNVKLMDGATELGISIDLNSENSFIINPHSKLNVNSSYTVKLLTGLTNTGGIALREEFNWSFTTYNSDPDSGEVTTLAGSTTGGNSDGTGSSASFNSPQHLTMEIGEASLFVTDTGNHRIRKISLPSGVVTTVAGSTSGYTAATGTLARFNSPKGIFAAPLSGVTYYFVSDSGNNSIRRMTTAYAVTNSFGTSVNSAGYVISTSTTAQRYRNPEGFALDMLTGILYVSDTGNHCIRKTTYTGTGVSSSSPNTSCFAGASPSAGLGTSGFINGANTSARFYNPKGIAVDLAGNIYVADSGNHSIRRITPGGSVSTIAGNGIAGYVNGYGTTARFDSPVGIVSDGANTLYVTDSGNCTIRKLVMDSGKTFAYVSTYAGATTDVDTGKCDMVNGTRLTSRFNSPKGLWRDTNGVIYVTDTGNNMIRKITP